MYIFYMYFRKVAEQRYDLSILFPTKGMWPVPLWLPMLKGTLICVPNKHIFP